MKADLSPGVQRKAFMAENMVTTPLKHKEGFKQMPSKPRILIIADGKKARVFDTGSRVVKIKNIKKQNLLYGCFKKQSTQR